MISRNKQFSYLSSEIFYYIDYEDQYDKDFIDHCFDLVENILTNGKTNETSKHRYTKNRKHRKHHDQLKQKYH